MKFGNHEETSTKLGKRITYNMEKTLPYLRENIIPINADNNNKSIVFAVAVVI